MGNLLTKVRAGLGYVLIQKVLGKLRHAVWYVKTSAPYRVFKWLGYLLLRQVFVTVRSVWWLLSGVTFRRWWSRLPRNYGTSAHVQKIIGRYKVDPVLEMSEEYNFLTTHHTFQHPEVILQDNVTLYFITKTEAFFVETHPDIDVKSSETNAFMRLAQFTHARKLISLPLSSLHRVAQQIGDPPGQLIFLNNTARCGSTVLVQMFESSSHCLALSEPDALNAISFLSRRLPEETVLRILQSVVRVLCKPYKGKTYESYLLKTTAPGIWASALMEKQFPEAKILFMYRDGVKVGDSLECASQQMPLLRTLFLITYYFPFLPKSLQVKFCDYFLNFPDCPKKRSPSIYACGFYFWTSVMSKYMKLRQQGCSIVGVKYEHLMENPTENFEVILNHCGLPTQWSSLALKALNKDSQRNSPLSMKELNKVKSYSVKFNKDVKPDCDLMCLWSNVPYDAPNDWTPEGTITVSKCGATIKEKGTSLDWGAKANGVVKPLNGYK